MQNITTRVAQVFWGLVIVAVDVHIGRFDVVPDFVGYSLIALGAAGLVAWSSHFQTARFLSWALVPVSPALLIFHGGFLKLIWVLSLALEGGLMWFLLGGVMAFAESRNRHTWVSRASVCRWVYLGLLAAGLATTWIARGVPSLARVIASVTYIATWCVLAAILYLIYLVQGEAAKSTTPASTQPEDPIKEAA